MPDSVMVCPATVAVASTYCTAGAVVGGTVVAAAVVVGATVVVVSATVVVTSTVVGGASDVVGLTTTASVGAYSRERMPVRSVTAASDGSRRAAGPVMVPSRPVKETATPVMPATLSCCSTSLVRSFSILGTDTATVMRNRRTKASNPRMSRPVRVFIRPAGPGGGAVPRRPWRPTVLAGRAGQPPLRVRVVAPTRFARQCIGAIACAGQPDAARSGHDTAIRRALSRRGR